ncbi:MAG: LemA family protein [Zoogloeaceae bacterium]|jgi:LemA protein|nr:LemA family protein [Zoogloeaceae bacterium]
MKTVVVLAVVIVAVVIWGVSIYNGLVNLFNQIRNAFSQIDVQLQRRYDLIPNLVETAKGYLKHERETLEAVIAARNTAQAAAKSASDNPDAAALRKLQGAESALEGLLTKFFALSEAYPDLKANQNMAQLQEELASTENRIAFARQAYNDAVMRYNIHRESFPNSLLAAPFGFKPAEQWLSAEGSVIRQNVKVSFS